MKRSEGLPFVKLMMLVNSMAPLFLLVAVRGISNVITDTQLWASAAVLVMIPYLMIQGRIARVKKSNDTYLLNVEQWRNNKEYLFTYLFTVLLPLYSVSITTEREFAAVVLAILFIMFVLWNLNLHFINVLFALQGYKVYTLEDLDGAILLSNRSYIPKKITEIKVHRLSNSVFIELKDHNYENN